MDNEKNQVPKDIHELVQQLFGKPRKKTAEERSAPKKTLRPTHPPLSRTHKVFQIMSSTYLQKWTGQITPDVYDIAIAQWNSAIQDIPDDLLRRALKDCAVKFAWPPSIKEFRELCLSYHSRYLDAKQVVSEDPRKWNEDGTVNVSREAQEAKNAIWSILGLKHKIIDTKIYNHPAYAMEDAKISNS